MINFKLVYLDTGRLVPNQNDYTVKLSHKWNHNSQIYSIYKNGKFVGYVNKGTKSQQREIQRIENDRIKRKEREYKKEPKKVFNEKSINFISSEFVDMVYQKGYTQGRTASEVPFQVQSMTNYVNYLNNALNSGFITEDAAFEWYQKYKDAKTDDERNDLWKEVKEFCLELGYTDSL